MSERVLKTLREFGDFQAAYEGSIPFEADLERRRGWVCGRRSRVVLTPRRWRQAQQRIKPYQQLRYWSTVPFRHGPHDVVKFSAIPSPGNSVRPLQKSNPKGLQDELVRHIKEDSQMSWFDFAVQFLDTGKMTYWGKTRDASFWVENASVSGAKARHLSTPSRGLLF
jgi:hypothetical protein